MGMKYSVPTQGNPMPWRRFGNVSLGEHLLGEDTADLEPLGFSGDAVEIDCPRCKFQLGRVPVELIGEELEDITFSHILPVLEWHLSRCSQSLTASSRI
jgi:Fe-S oxidoreductase